MTATRDGKRWERYIDDFLVEAVQKEPSVGVSVEVELAAHPVELTLRIHTFMAIHIVIPYEKTDIITGQ